MSRNKKGFTLIEVVIVVVAIGIIAAFAIPHYFKDNAKEHAKDTLGQLYGGQVVYHLAHEEYASTIDLLGVNVLSDSTYQYTITKSDACGFLIRAERQDGKGPFYTIDEDSVLTGFYR